MPGQDAPIVFADYTGLTVQDFQVRGIDTALLVDPFNTLAFKTALTFDAVAGQLVTVTQTPVIVFVDGALPVPEASTWAMVLAGLVGVGAVTRRRTGVQAASA